MATDEPVAELDDELDEAPELGDEEVATLGVEELLVVLREEEPPVDEVDELTWM